MHSILFIFLCTVCTPAYGMTNYPHESDSRNSLDNLLEDPTNTNREALQRKFHKKKRPFLKKCLAIGLMTLCATTIIPDITGLNSTTHLSEHVSPITYYSTTREDFLYEMGKLKYKKAKKECTDKLMPQSPYYFKDDVIPR